MASIQTGIELNDQFSSVIHGIINSVNLAVSAMYDMQQGMNAGIDTSSLEGAINEINQATAAFVNLEEVMQESSPQVTAPEAPIPQNPVPFQWQSDNMEVFTGTGVERFRQEIQSANHMLNTLYATQQQIERTASGMDILPDAAVQDMNAMGERLQMIQQRISQIENNPVNFGTDSANAELERLRSQLNQAVQEQQDLNDAMRDMDVSAANEAYLRLSQTVGRTEQYIRDNVDEQDRFNQAIQEGTTQSNGLANTIKNALSKYVNIQNIGKALNISDELVQSTARLNQMNDGLQSTDELVDMVYAAAQDARGSFSQMTDVVARFGNNARDAFGSSEEVVAFAGLIQKQMTIAGASTQEAANAQLQLSQALGSGVLRGDELNSIFEQAPNLIQSIADYMGVPIGKIREMASEGELTADIVKSAIFAASDDINAKFEEMPMTWGQVWQSMQNTAVIAFQPVLEKINDLANSETFQNFVDNVMGAMAILANTVLNIFDVIGQVGGFISDNWSVLSPIIYGVAAAMGLYTIALIANSIAQEINNVSKDFATLKTHTHAAAQMMEAGSTFTATAAQHGFNAALLACPLTWIIIKIIALIAIIYAVCSAIAKLTGVATSGFGIICGGVNVVIQFFRNLGLMVGNIALGIGNAIAALCSNMFTAFGNAINSIQSLFYNLLSTALSVISQIAETLNKLPFIEFDVGAISGAADKYAAKAAKLAGDKKSYKSVGDAFNKGFNTYDAFGNGWVSDAFHAGTAWGDGIADKMKGMLNKDKDEDEDSGNELLNMGDKIPSQDYSPEPYPVPVDIGGGIDGIGNGVSDIAGNTADIADAVEITEEDLKYLRDIAEQETVNRYTIAEITIDQSGMQNSINNGEDIDGFVRRLTESVNEAVEIITEGVHA